MPFGRRRPLMRAAVVGGGAYMAGKHTANKQEAEAQQNAQIADLQQQQQQAPAQAVPPPPPPPAYAPTAPAPAAGGLTSDTITQLKELKGLLDAGVLTQEEFDGQKVKLLGAS